MHSNIMQENSMSVTFCETILFRFKPEWFHGLLNEALTSQTFYCNQWRTHKIFMGGFHSVGYGVICI